MRLKPLRRPDEPPGAAPTPPPSGPSSPGSDSAAEWLRVVQAQQAQITTMATLLRTSGAEQARQVEAMTAQIEAAFKAQKETLEVNRAQGDVLEGFIASLDGQIAKLMTATAALIKVATNLTVLMTTAQEEQQQQ